MAVVMEQIVLSASSGIQSLNFQVCGKQSNGSLLRKQGHPAMEAWGSALCGEVLLFCDYFTQNYFSSHSRYYGIYAN